MVEDQQNHDQPLKIIEIAEEEKDGKTVHELKLNEDNLKKIMLHPDVANNAVMIVAIAGALRKGKSFLLDFFIKYLEAQMSANWLGDDDEIKGFQWRNGTAIVTYGIQIWSKPFMFENKDGKKVAVLLMDTQGIFDCRSTKQDGANIFTLSCLISSVQIYNLMHQLQADDLENLEFFTEFVKTVKRCSDITADGRSRIMLLIRDWGCPEEFSYGDEGGSRYVDMQLEIEENQPEQQKKIRRTLKEGVLDLTGYLLPYPGKAVATEKLYRCLVKDVDKDFLHFVKILVSNIFSKKNMATKQMNGADVRGKEMVDYIEKFVSVLNDGKCPSLETTVEVIAEKGRQLGITEALALYNSQMQQCLDKSEVSMKKLEEYHQKFKKHAFDSMEKYPRIIVAEHEVECFINLGNKIDDAYKSYQSQTTEAKEKIRKEKRIEFVKTYIVPISIAGSAIIFNYFPVIACTTATIGVFSWGISKYF